MEDDDFIFEVGEGPLPKSLGGHNKIASIYEICQLGLPILPTLVLRAWNDAVALRVHNFVHRHGWSRVMIRSDRKPEVPNSPRGGFLFDLGLIPGVTRDLLARDRIVLVIEPANKYDNLYGINVLFDTHSGEVLLEVVGPGFDATDINRGDISPHEHIILSTKSETITPRVIRKQSVTTAKYLESVSQRLAKIGQEVLLREGPGRCSSEEVDLEKIGENFLQREGLSLLHRSSYTPLPRNYLLKLVSYIRDLPWRLPSSGKDARYVISLSILNDPGPRFIFWDIVRPARKYG
jgi:hypothetical protein